MQQYGGGLLTMLHRQIEARFGPHTGLGVRLLDAQSLEDLLK